VCLEILGFTNTHCRAKKSKPGQITPAAKGYVIGTIGDAVARELKSYTVIKFVIRPPFKKK